MTKALIWERVQARVPDGADPKSFLNAVLDAIMDLLLETGRVEIRGFGVLEVRIRRARRARNPKTGESIHVPATRWIAFKAGKELCQRLANSQSPPILPDAVGE